MSARALEPHDLAALTALRLEGIRLFPQAFLLTEAEALTAAEDAMLGWINSGNAFGIFDKTTLVGFAGLKGQGFAMSQHRAHVGPFYVTPDYHGLGMADLLLEHLMDVARARRATQVELWVAEANARARAFYASHGFTSMGRIPNAVIQDGTSHDDLFMVCDLSQDRPVRGPDGLRQLHQGDWRIFHKIRIEMLRDAPRCFGSPYSEWVEKPRDDIMTWLTSVNLWAVVEKGAVVATAGWHPLKGRVLSHRGHVIAVYTAPHARGRGLSRHLLEVIAEQAKTAGIVQLELDVGAENAAAIAVYEAAGYRVTGTIPNCLNHDGYIHDQHLMIRPLGA